VSEALDAAVALHAALDEEVSAARLAVVDANQALTSMQKVAAQAAQVVALLEQAPVPDPTPVPTPPPSPIPDDANTVRIGAATYPLAGINPGRLDYPGGRGPDQLVAYRAPVGFTTTNAYGTECTVMAGQVIAVIDREAISQAAGVIVPVGGYVLSGHGKARAWLNEHAVRGARVDVVHTDVPTPTPTPPPVPVPVQGGRTIATYRKDGSGSTASIPAGINQFRYSFFQNNQLVEWGGETVATQAANLGQWLDGGGRQVLISAGGSKGSVNTSNRGAFLGGFLAAEAKLGGRVTGIDWDLEAAAMVVDDVVAISRALAEGRKDSYLISFAPPGGDPVGPALLAAVALHKAGYRVQVGQQLYEGNVYITESAAIGALRRAVDAGLPPSCVLLGCMVGGDARHWTIPMCVQVARAALAQWEDFGGCYVWSEGNQAQDQAWATAMAAVFA